MYVCVCMRVRVFMSSYLLKLLSERILFYFIFSTEIELTHNITLFSGGQHSDSITLNLTLCSPQAQLPSVTTTQLSHNNTSSGLYSVPFIPVTYSFHNWKPVSLTPLHPACSPLRPLPTGNHPFLLREFFEAYVERRSLKG